MTAVKERLRGSLPVFIVAVCALQPLLDILSYWVQELNFSNLPTLALRMFWLAVVVVWAFIISEKKYVYFIAAGIIAAFWAFHFAVCCKVGYISVFSDFTNYVRVAQLPMLTICFITFFSANKKSFEALKLGFCVNYLIIAVSQIISPLSGTDIHTYKVVKMGFLGWFANTNTQCLIVAMIIPVMLWTLYSSKHKILFYLAVPISFAQLYFFGTRLSYASIFGITVGFIFLLIINKNIDKKAIAVLSVSALLCVVFVTYSPMYRMRSNHELVSNQRQELVDEKIKEHQITDPNDHTNVDYSLYEEVYSLYCSDLIDRFGIERVVDKLDYTLEISDLMNVRKIKIAYCELLMEDHPAISAFSGVELGQTVVGDRTYDVENDFHGIMFLYGYIGLALLVAFLLYFVYLVIRALCTDFFKYMTMDAGVFGMSFLIALISAYNTAGLLRRPNASFYLSVVLAVIFYLVKIREYPNTAKRLRKHKAGKGE